MKKYYAAVLLLFTSFQCLSHSDSAYYHGTEDLAARTSWMGNLDSSLALASLSIPGTHDSGALYGGDITQTQSLTIAQQLQAGIRFYDIRLRSVDDKLQVYHGMIDQHLKFSDVLDNMASFLDKYPTETLLLRIKKEYSDKNCELSFSEALKEELTKYWHYLYRNSYFYTSEISLGDVRGKILLLNDFHDGTGLFNEKTGVGLTYHPFFNKTDSYRMTHNWDLYDKWIIAKYYLERNTEYNLPSHVSLPHANMLYIVGSTGSFPYFVASGHSSHGTSAPRLATGLTTPGWKGSYPDFPRVSCFIGICTIAFEGLNTLTKNYILQNDVNYTGVVVSDFPGEGLIDAIINSNPVEKFNNRKLRFSTTSQCIISLNTYTGNKNFIDLPLHVDCENKVNDFSYDESNEELTYGNKCLTKVDFFNKQYGIFEACDGSANQNWQFDGRHVYFWANNLIPGKMVKLCLTYEPKQLFIGLEVCKSEREDQIINVL